MARKRRRAAWASIASVGAGVWRIRYWAEGPDGYRRRSKTVRGTRKDAERVRSELMLAHSEDAPCPTVGEVYERWFLPAQRERVTEGTLRQYESAWRLHIAPAWAEVPCDAVRPLEVQQWLSGMGRSAALASMKVLRPSLDYAVRYGLVASNPFRERYLLPSAATVRSLDEGAWDEGELGDAWHGLMGEWFEGAYLMMAFGGCRVGEALGVMRPDVELREVGGHPFALVRVVRQVDKDGHPTDAMKTEQSRRTAIVPGRAGARVAWLAAHADSPWLTGNGLGGCASQQTLRSAWKAWCRSAGRDALAMRALRASWQTMARWRWGLPPWVSERLMGHAGDTVTARHYDRPEADAMLAVVARSYSERPYDAAWDWAVWD